ncbi:unnamed protein product [Callosobruchus maculatus]|uniref:Genetic suppressor element-like domain-containing protein n=1 Tax=Callosobruchus maculatus TaxID=64391 RepID=A0A653C431_CALMS|nr:unnamed protein product [Callosobruchus maculatus]
MTEKTKPNQEAAAFAATGSSSLRSFEPRLPTNHVDRYPASSLSDLSRSGFQPYRPEERIPHLPVGMELPYSPYGPYPTLPLIDDPLYYERMGIIRPPWPPIGHPYLPYMLPGTAMPLYLHERLKLEEEQHRRLAALRKEEEQRELLERDLQLHREKERVQREREKVQSRMSPHHPLNASQQPLVLPILQPTGMLPPPVGLPSSAAPVSSRHSPLGAPPPSSSAFLTPSTPPGQPPTGYSVPRSSPSLQRHSPSVNASASAFSLNLSQRQSPVMQPSGPLINAVNLAPPLPPLTPSSQSQPRSSPKPPTPSRQSRSPAVSASPVPMSVPPMPEPPSPSQRSQMEDAQAQQHQQLQQQQPQSQQQHQQQIPQHQPQQVEPQRIESARKSTIPPILASDVLVAAAPVVQQPPPSIRHFTTFDIDSIVNDHQNITREGPQHPEPTIVASPSIPIIKTPITSVPVTATAQLTRVHETQAKLQIDFRGNSTTLCTSVTSLPAACPTTPSTSTVTTSAAIVCSYSYGDKSNEVKHAFTPPAEETGGVPDVHSPQLPIPSPNYPSYNASVPQTARLQHYDQTKTHTKVAALPKAIKKKSYHRSKMGESQFTVLNIPNVAVQGPPPVKKQKLSKIDLAVIRKKAVRKTNDVEKEKVAEMRREKVTKEYGVTVLDYSDCSSSGSSYESSTDSEEESGVDMIIKSGPPSKPDINPMKLQFLRQFDITTHAIKNCLEFEKLDKRKWLPPTVLEETETVDLPHLNLPVPSKAPSLTNIMQNPKAKKSLVTVSPDMKTENERIWKEIVQERLRRNCESNLTMFYKRVYQKSALDSQNASTVVNDTILKLPLVHRFKAKKEPDKNNSPPVNYLPLTMILIENQKSNGIVFPKEANGEKENQQVVKEDSKFKWPGIAEVVESYRMYAKERSLDIAHFKKRCSILMKETLRKQNEVKYLEKKQRELNTVLFRNERERKQLQRLIDQLTNIINVFR